jgi:dipeptidyl aminopeptidase/acylaminoacyl peptidase
MTRPFPLAILAVALTLPHHASGDNRRLTLDDVRSLVRLSDPQISPDGRTVLVVVTRPDYEANEWRSDLVAIEVASGAPAVLVRRRQNLAHLRWSPSGDRFAFLASVNGERQIYVSAPPREPVRITESATGVRFFAWKPDGSAIAYVATDERPTRTGPARHDDTFTVASDHYQTTAAALPSHLWLVPAAVGPARPGPARRLTSGTWSLATALASSPLSWSADGRTIACVRFPSGSPGDSDQGTVTLLDVAGGSDPRPLTGRTLRESNALFSPDGTRIAFTYPRAGDPANVDEALVAPAGGGPGEVHSATLDRQVTLEGWWPDGSSLLLSGADGTRSALWRQPLGGAGRKLDLGAVASVDGVSIARTGALALVGSERAWPAEVYVLTADDPPRRLSDFNRPVAQIPLGRNERFTVTAPDGLAGDGVVTYPPSFDPTRRHPLVLVIHGGPTASSTEGFSALVQLLAARGWIVYQPNYRGSHNLGNAYQRAIANDAAEGPGRDVMAGVDALIAQGFVDPARVAVSGWSYGGFLTAWLIGRYPDRWRAAVAGAAPVDLTDMYALTDLNVMRRHAITDSPFVGDNLRKYMAMSPLVHLSKARTPTLVMSTTGDVRVVVTGSYKIHRALKDNGVPVEFVAFPGGGHSPADPVRHLERDRRWVEWLARWLH